MHSPNLYDELGDYARDLIKNKARMLVGKAGFRASDLEDLEQELALDLFTRLPKYNPERARRTTFMAMVVDHKLSALLDERHAQCRDWRMCRESLDECADCEDGLSRADTLADAAAPTSDDLALEIDLQRALDTLPADLRELWDLLLDSNINRVARRAGISRATIYAKRDRLREALREAGL